MKIIVCYTVPKKKKTDLAQGPAADKTGLDSTYIVVPENPGKIPGFNSRCSRLELINDPSLSLAGWLPSRLALPHSVD